VRSVHTEAGEGLRVSAHARARLAGFLRLAIVCAAVLAAALSTPAQDDTQKPRDLANQSLEDLMNIEVTSVSKKEQKLSRTAAAAFVITQEDIRRSGATNIPDCLRMVPGLDVAQMNANTWAIGARGFNAQYSRKLLVMVDGRTVYTPSFDGVYWDTLNVPLEDIERIEVIRGPGGTIWGANAVNAVINIITKKASETPGAMVVAGAGNLLQGFGTTQYGGKAGERTDYRAYLTYFNQEHMVDLTGQSGEDGRHMLQGGFRTDSALSTKDELTVQGDLYGSREGLPASVLTSLTSPVLVQEALIGDQGGGFLQAVWNHTFSKRSDTSFQISYDRYTRSDPRLPQARGTLNLDFQHHFAWGERQDIVWGLDYRNTSDNFGASVGVSFNPASRADNLVSSFIQDEIAIFPDRLYLTIGTKLEYNDYTGNGLMPSARVAWTPSGRNTLWAAVSRAERTPTRNDTALQYNVPGGTGPGGLPVVVSIQGNPNFQNEDLVAYEAGYRASVFERLSFDFAAYFNDYTHLETTDPSALVLVNTPAPPHYVFPLVFKNLMHGETHGIEIAANWKATGRWTLSPGYAFEQLHMHTDATSTGSTTPSYVDGSSPTHSAQLRSYFTLPHGFSWDTSAYFVDRLPSQGVASYTRLDSQLTLRLQGGLLLSFVGQNLLKDHHVEFIDPLSNVQPSQIKRSAFVKIAWTF
jgi:iron complex outermembrane receptor protein